MQSRGVTESESVAPVKAPVEQRARLAGGGGRKSGTSGYRWRDR